MIFRQVRQLLQIFQQKVNQVDMIGNVLQIQIKKKQIHRKISQVVCGIEVGF